MSCAKSQAAVADRPHLLPPPPIHFDEIQAERAGEFAGAWQLLVNFRLPTCSGCLSGLRWGATPHANADWACRNAADRQRPLRAYPHLRYRVGFSRASLKSKKAAIEADASAALFRPRRAVHLVVE